MLRAYALTVLLVPASFAQEAKAPARIPAMTPGVTPLVSPSLPLTPVNTAGLGELLRKAAANALGYGQTSVIPGGMALGFAPQANDTQKPAPPSLPNSAMSPTKGGTVQTPGLAASAPQSQAPGMQSPSRIEGTRSALPGMLPLVFEASHGMHAVFQNGKTIAAKTEALKQPLETASGLSVAGAGRGSEEAAKRLGDGIWDVMMDERSGGSGEAKTALRDAMGSTGGGVSGSNAGAHAGSLAGEERAVMEALDYSALSGGPSAAAYAARSVYGAPVEGATILVAPGGDAFLIEAADAAETARQYARESLAAQNGAAAEKALKAGPVEKVWLQAFDSVLKLFSSTYGTAELKPGWSAEPGPGTNPNNGRGISKRDGTGTGQGGSGTGVTIVPATRLVSRLAAQNAAKDAPVLGPGAGFTVPSPKSIPDHLLVLSLLPLAALALAYLREFRR